MANINDVFKTIGASNHTDKKRQSDDYYATDPVAAEQWLGKLKLPGPIWEPACGGGHLSEVFERNGYQVLSTDLIDRNYGTPDVDFLMYDKPWNGDIVTNPPYKHAEQFVRHAIGMIQTGHYVCMLLKLTFLEGQKRKKLFEQYPPKYIYVFSSRLLCAKNGDFNEMKKGGGEIQAYAWFVWQKGNTELPVLDWIN